MSDFLSNLIAKNTGVVEGIRPYLPSVFEPVAPGGEIPEMFEERSAARPAQVSDPPASAAPAERSPAVPTTPAPARSEERKVEIAREWTARDREPAAEPGAPAGRTSVAAGNVEPVARESVIERPVFIEKLTAGAAESQLPIRSGPAIKKSESQAAEAPAEKYLERPRPTALLIVDSRPDAAVFRAASREGAPPREAGASVDPTATVPGPSHERAMPVPGRRAAGREPRLRQDASARTEPEIHVTIGRVEIRATTAAQAPGPRRNAPQPMSLEEYQRRRTSGGQR